MRTPGECHAPLPRLLRKLLMCLAALCETEIAIPCFLQISVVFGFVIGYRPLP